jgi:hypothetical protein
MSRSLKAGLSGACFALGAVWALAAALKLIFGVAVSFPLLPPFSLEQVDVTKSIIVALILFAVAALLGRRGSVQQSELTSAPPRRRSSEEL